LIDADLRRPAQHRLGARPKSPGLSELLTGAHPLEAVIQPAVTPGLDFIPSGGGANFTLSMIYTNRLRELITTLRGRYDKIIFDSPPIIGVSDASVLAGAMDGVVLLIQHRRNPAAMVLRAQQIVNGLKVPMLGVVLNQVPLRSGEDYGYYTHNYAYYSEGQRPKRRATTPGKDDKSAPPADKLVLGESDDRKS
ncbi:MAG: CpsD/CapB family tyrosine-protein kinase, partial [Undibacterium sp.]|nr:CpsD/CapB family tyrosine-protein kinase [Opitutaceae bacterium]